MALNPEILELLVCPRCRNALQASSEEEGLICSSCNLLYPIKNDIPVLIEDEAFPIQFSTSGGSGVGSEKRSLALFEIISGKSKGQIVKLPLGTCKAIGRSLDDLNKTKIFNVDSTMSLDEQTKKLIVNYISKQSSDPAPLKESSIEKIGAFTRLPDLILDDPSISRMHAMLFHDNQGAGILDLVSKNGTWVNGDEVESKTLHEGDTVEVGSSKMVFSYQ